MQKLFKNTGLMKVFVTIALILLCGFLYSCNHGTSRNMQESIETQPTGDKTAGKPEAAESQTANLHTSQSHEASGQNSSGASAGQEEPKMFVYVSGSVHNPGVYEAASGMRMFQVIELAGGITEDGCDTWLNLAQPVQDGQKIYVPSKAEAAQDNWQNQAGQNTQDMGNSKVNLNTATKEQLMTLPGVGAAKAEDIIAYRKNNGAYSRIEDIMNISGIKEAAFTKLKDYICV